MLDSLIENEHGPPIRLYSLIDTGATTSLIDKSCLPPWLLERATPRERTIYGFDSTSTPAISTHELDLAVKSDGITLNVRAAIVENACVDLILGLDAIQSNEISIIGKPNSVKIYAKKDEIRVSTRSAFAVRVHKTTSIAPMTTRRVQLVVDMPPEYHRPNRQTEVILQLMPQHTADPFPGRFFLPKDGILAPFLSNMEELSSHSLKEGSLVGYVSRLEDFNTTALHETIGAAIAHQHQDVQSSILRSNTSSIEFVNAARATMDSPQLEIDHLLVPQRKRVADLLSKHSAVLVKSLEEGGVASVPAYSMETTTEKPLRQGPREMNPLKAAAVDEEISKMLASGVIKEHKGPWASPVHMVRKKDGSWRFCIDYRHLNAITTDEVYPLPRIQSVLQSLSGARYFSVLDLASGYWQIKMDLESSRKAAFITHRGQYAPQAMPFGLKNAAPAFQRAMNEILKDHIGKICYVYIDDILIFSKSFDEHLSHVQTILETLAKANMRVKAAKCRWFQSEVSYLGHTVSEKGISPIDAKIAAIVDAPAPTDKTELRSFMGLANYYRRFIRHFATLARRLNNLLRKNTPFVWTDELQRDFERLKRKLTSYEVLAHPIYDGITPFIIDTDASNHGMGAVLSQVQKDKTERPIAFWSSGFATLKQSNYSATDREFLAIVKAVEHFAGMIDGGKIIVRTDHSALHHMFTSNTPQSGMRGRWLDKLQPYGIIPEYRPGKKNGNADGMSRPPIVKPLQTTSFSQTQAQSSPNSMLIDHQPSNEQHTSPPSNENSDSMSRSADVNSMDITIEIDSNAEAQANSESSTNLEHRETSDNAMDVSDPLPAPIEHSIRSNHGSIQHDQSIPQAAGDRSGSTEKTKEAITKSRTEEGNHTYERPLVRMPGPEGNADINHSLSAVSSSKTHRPTDDETLDDLSKLFCAHCQKQTDLTSMVRAEKFLTRTVGSNPASGHPQGEHSSSSSEQELSTSSPLSSRTLDQTLLHHTLDYQALGIDTEFSCTARDYSFQASPNFTGDVELVAIKLAFVAHATNKISQELKLFVEGEGRTMYEWQQQDEFVSKLFGLLQSDNSQSNSNEANSSSAAAPKITKTMKKMKEHLSIHDKLLFHKKRFVVPTKLKNLILQELHASPVAGGHFGIDGTYSKVAKSYWWPKMRADVNKYVDACASCKLIKSKHTKPAGLIQPIAPTSRLFQRVGIDFVGPLKPTASGKRHILVLVDYYTHWVEAFPLSEQKATSVVDVFVNEIIPRFGCPEELLSDQGANFLSDLAHQLYSIMQTRKLTTTPYHPQTNGLTERTNGILKRVISHFTNFNRDNWDLILPWALLTYRTTPTPALKDLSPYQLLYGQDARHPLLRAIHDPDKNPDASGRGYINELHKFVLQHLEVGKNAIESSFRKQAREIVLANSFAKQERMRERENEKRRDVQYSPGDLVYMRIPYGALGPPSLARRFKGPYKIVRQHAKSQVNYIVYDICAQKFHTVHVASLIPAPKESNSPVSALLQLPKTQGKGISVDVPILGKAPSNRVDSAPYTESEFNRLQSRSRLLPHLQTFHDRLYKLMILADNIKPSEADPHTLLKHFFEDILEDYRDLLYAEDQPRMLEQWKKAEEEKSSTRDVKPFSYLIRSWLRNNRLRLHRPEDVEHLHR